MAIVASVKSRDTLDLLLAFNPHYYWRVSPAEAHGLTLEWACGYDVRGYATYLHREDSLYISSVFHLPGAQGIVKAALGYADYCWPHRHQQIDVFDGLLPDVYASRGFVETRREPFDDKQAPVAWQESYGRPDVVFMTRPSWYERNPS